MNLEKYFELCNQYDWMYFMSDNQRVFEKHSKLLDQIILYSKDHHDAFLAWREYWSGGEKPALEDFQ